jgi:hypothetical protein
LIRFIGIIEARRKNILEFQKKVPRAFELNCGSFLHASEE